MILVLLSKHESTHDRLLSSGPTTNKILDFWKGLNVSVAQNSRCGEKVLYKILELEGALKATQSNPFILCREETHAGHDCNILRFQNHLVAELGKNPDSERHSSSVYFVSTAALAMDPGVPESAIPLRTFTFIRL